MIRKSFLPLFVFLLMFSFVRTQVSAQQQQDVTTTPTPAPVDYLLPYPGILPDSPLYGLKVLRDRIVGFLISDPLKKAEFDLLQADKRLAAGQMLLQKNPKEFDLVGTTISKGENYFFEAMNQVEMATKQGEDPSSLLQKMLLSSQKHVEVMQQMEKSAPSNLQNSLKRDENRVNDFGKRVLDTINKK